MARITAALLAVAFVTTGCIGGDDDERESVSKEDFIENADAICAAYEERIDAAGAQLASDATMDDVVELFNEELVPLFSEQIDELRELDLPEDDADDLEALWDELERARDELQEMVNDDINAVLRADNDPFAEANAFAQEYGFQECGSSD